MGYDYEGFDFEINGSKVVHMNDDGTVETADGFTYYWEDNSYSDSETGHQIAFEGEWKLYSEPCED